MYRPFDTCFPLMQPYSKACLWSIRVLMLIQKNMNWKLTDMFIVYFIYDLITCMPRDNFWILTNKHVRHSSPRQTISTCSHKLTKCCWVSSGPSSLHSPPPPPHPHPLPGPVLAPTYAHVSPIEKKKLLENHLIRSYIIAA